MASSKTAAETTANVHYIENPAFEQIRAAQTMQGLLGISNSEVARRANVAGSTYSEIVNNRYRGNINKVCDKLRIWVAAEERRLETHSAVGEREVGLVETSMVKEIKTALRLAQSMPAMVTITLGSGNGKSETLKQFSAQTPHAYRVVIEPTDGGVRPMIHAIGEVLGVNAWRASTTWTEVRNRLSRASGRQCILLVDEAQNLSDEAVNQLRFLLDECGCGIALTGNQDLMSRYAVSASREGYGQIHRRIFMRVNIKVAPPEDIDLVVERHGVTDAGIRNLCRQIGQKPGGIGQVVDTLKYAALLAYGRGEQYTAADVRNAWTNRAREELY